eukprot:2754-Heterococcus_DN1.PRE.1
MAMYLLDLPGAAADVHVQSSTSKKSPLHYAVPFESVVQLLLQRGADVHARNERGEQPLWHAHTLPVVKLLLAAGADATAVDGAPGSSVLHSQAKCGTCAGVICLLLKAGADPTGTVVCAETVVSPAHLADINGHFALEALLSRAAEDYRKKLTASTLAVNSETVTADSSSGDSGVSTSAASTASSVDSSSSAVSTAGTSKAADIVERVDNALHGQHTENASRDAATTQQQQQQHKVRKVKQPCANSSKLTTKLCKRCAAVYYCSVQCQKACFADAQHRSQCEAIAPDIV